LCDGHWLVYMWRGVLNVYSDKNFRELFAPVKEE
jgi:hypothetical protein